MSFTIKIPSLSSSYSYNNNFKIPTKKPNFLHLKPLMIQSLPIKPLNFATPTIFSQTISYPDDQNVVNLRLKRLISEFKALSEPIDRVKRLLGYASVLPRLGELTRSPENRVRGCAAQVWLEVERDEYGRMRFGADSDSEITKGFCSCLIFLLDGAFAEDVLKVKAEDLIDMNVGLPVRSRVNSWHNVLVNMQERTKCFLLEEEEEEEEEIFQQKEDNNLLETFPSLVVPSDTMIPKGEVCFRD